MNLQRKLALAFLDEHAEDAAAVLESLSMTEAAGILTSNPAERAAEVLRWMTPERGTAILEQMDPTRAADLVARLPVEVAAASLRRLDPERRDVLTASLPADLQRALTSLLRFPAGTAGALMDPRVSVLTADLTVADALDHLRRTRDHTLYNLYVIDRQRTLVGVLNLQELLEAPPKEPVSTIMRSPDLRLPATANRDQIVAHRGWRQVYSLPVVDESGVLLGAVRYRTLRQLEAEFDRLQPTSNAASTSRALGDLFATGAGGLADAILIALAPSENAPPGDGVES